VGGRQTEDGLRAYLGSVADIVKAMDAAEAGMMPQRTAHLGFGDVPAVVVVADGSGCGRRDRRGVGGRRSDAGASVGTYLALAALGRLVAPRIEERRSPTGGPPPPGTDSPRSAARCWTTASSGTPCTPWIPKRCRTSRPAIAGRIDRNVRLDVSSVALDMTNFATYIDNHQQQGPDRANAGRRNKKRTDLRLIGLGMVVTRAGGIPLVWHAYPGTGPTSPSSRP